MWESLKRFPRGRLSTRNFVMFFATLIVVSFGYLLMTPTPVYAAATWEGDNLVNEGETYEPFERGNARGLGAIPDSAQLYRTLDGGNGAGQAKFIYFEGGAPKSAGEATYVTYTLNPPNEYSDASNEQTVEVTPVSAVAQDQPGGETSCAIDGGAGWIICPVTRTMAAAMDAIYTAVAAFLVVTPLQTTDQGAMYRMWSLVRNIANICFIIAMLLIIYSHLTDIGLSNYNLKKMLPKLFVAAVLVNVSYWICAVAIDISNILGYAVQDLFNGVRSTLVGPEGNSWDITWESMASFLLSGGTLAAGAGIAAYVGTTALATAAVGGGVIWLFIPILLSVLFVVLVTFLILAARQAIITILVVLAPLAFVAFLLPNTEKWFDKWRSALFVLLLLFPAFSLVFGGAQLAATLIIQNATGPNALNMIILAMGVQVAPLAITPLLLKLGGGVLNRFANVVNNPTKGVFDRGKNYARERGEHSKAVGMGKLAERAERLGALGTGHPTKSDRKNRFGRWRETSRMNPYNAAYNRDYSRREREGMKTASEAMTEGVFQRTAAADRIYARAQDAGLHKHAGEEGNRRRYQEGLTVGTTPYDAYRRGLHHSAHEDKSKAEIFEASLAAHSERDFREKLNSAATPQYRQLKDLKIHTDVDKGIADMNVREVDATGKQALQREIFGDKALKDMNVRTVRLEKEASTIENVLRQRAEDEWESITTITTNPNFSPDLRNLRLQETESSQALERSKKQWTELVENIGAQGASAPTITTSADKAVADNLQQITKDISYADRAIQEAKLKQNENLMADFKASQEAILDPTKLGNPEILRRAAGIGGEQGMTRMYAQATKSVVDAAVAEVKDDRYLLSQFTRSQLHKVMFEGKGIRGEDVSVEMQQAAMYELLQKKGNNDDAQIIRNAVSGMGMAVDEDTGNYYELKQENGRMVIDRSRPIADEDVSRRRDWQQFFTDAASGSPHSQITLSGTDKSNAESGTMSGGFREGYVRDALGGKFGPEKMLKADIDELKHIYTDIDDDSGVYASLSPAKRAEVDTTIKDSILGLQKHPTYKGQIDDRNRGVMNQIIAQADPSYIASRDSEGRPQFYVDEDKALVHPSDATPDMKLFTAPVSGNIGYRSGTDWQIAQRW